MKKGKQAIRGAWGGFSAKVPQIKDVADFDLRLQKAGFKNRIDFSEFSGLSIVAINNWGVKSGFPPYLAPLLAICEMGLNLGLCDGTNLSEKEKLEIIKRLIESR